MANNMKIRQDGTRIIIEIDGNVDGDAPREPGTKGAYDKGRKGWLVASTSGNVSLPQRVNGREMKLGLNLFTADAPLKAKNSKGKAHEDESND